MKEISLTRGYLAVVDDEDFDWLNQWKWAYTGNGYAYRSIRTKEGVKHLSMHRQILQVLPNLQVDHINGNGLDNRRGNLRTCTHRQNCLNKRGFSVHNHGFKGMNYRKERNRWQAQIRVNGKNIHLGYYKTPEEAALAYNVAAVDHFGEFALLNKL